MQAIFILCILLFAGVRVAGRPLNTQALVDGQRARLRIPIEQLAPPDWQGKTSVFFKRMWVRGSYPEGAQSGTWHVEGIVRHSPSGAWTMEAEVARVYGGSPWYDRLVLLRKEFLGTLSEWMPPVDAAVARGIVWGDQSQLTREQKETFRNAGMSHILVASGFNITLVATSVLFFVRTLVSRRWSLVVAVVLLVAYAWVLGWGVPVVRALAMVLVAYGGVFLGRRGDAGYSLILLAALFVIFQPELAVSVSFQLSFLATAGLVFSPRMRNRLLEALVQNVMIYVFTLPVLLANFGFFTVLALPANIVIEPVISPLTELLMLAAIAGGIWWQAGRLVSLAAVPLVQFVRGVADVVGMSELGRVAISDVEVGVWLGYYSVLICGIWLGRRKGWL